MRYDVTLKDLLKSLPERLFDLLVQRRPLRILNIEFPSVQKRIPDFLTEIEDGSIHHLEIQAQPDPRFPWRMVYYHAAISEEYPDRPLIQQVLRVGGGQWTIPSSIRKDGLTLHYEVIDARDLDGEYLLGSPSTADRLLALLSRTTDPDETIRRIVRSWTTLPLRMQDDWAEKLVILCNLIGRETTTMPIPVDEETHQILLQLRAEWAIRDAAILRAQVQILLRQTEHRFGPLSAGQRERLESATEPEVQSWADRIIDAASIDELFGSGQP